MKGARVESQFLNLQERLVLCQTLDFGWPGKGVRHQKCEAPEGPFRLLVSDPVSRPRVNPIFKV